MRYLDRLRGAMAARDVDAVLVTDSVNVSWLTQFSGSFGCAIVTQSDAVFITDSRYRVQAADQVRNMPVVSYGSPTKLIDFIADQLKSLAISRLWFEGQSLTYATFEQYRDGLGVELVSAGDLVSPLRKVKFPEEVEIIRDCCRLADECFAHVQRMIRPGVSELDLSIEMEFFFRRHGAVSAFDFIVASGWRSALPHGRASEKIVEAGDFLTFDFGAGMRGYNSDITRTVAVGDPSPRHREVYDLLLKSQLAALEMMRPGVNGADVDRRVREVLDERELSHAFGHGLGHGLGRAVHDTGRLTSNTEEILEVGQVWTVEPGVYFDGWGGARIEDDVVVTADGIEVLTQAPKELLVF